MKVMKITSIALCLLLVHNDAAIRAAANGSTHYGKATILHKKDAHHAARAGDVTLVRAWYEQTNDAQASYKGQTLLHTAAKHNQSEIIRFLVDHGAELEASQKHRSLAPLHVACLAGHQSAVAELLECGASPTKPTKNGTAALYFAIEGGNTHIVIALLKVKPVRELINASIYSPFSSSIRECKFEIFTMLAQAMIDQHVFVQDLAIDCRSLIVSLLLKCYESGDAVSDLQRLQYLQLAISIGADINDSTPLGNCVSNDDYDCLQALLYHGANPFKEDNFKYTPFQRACRRRSADFVALFFEAPGFLEHEYLTDPSHRQRLFDAAERNPDKEVLRLLERNLKRPPKKGFFSFFCSSS